MRFLRELEEKIEGGDNGDSFTSAAERIVFSR